MRWLHPDMDGWMDGWMDGQMDGQTHRHTDRHTDTPTDTQADRQTGRQTDRCEVTPHIGICFQQVRNGIYVQHENKDRYMCQIHEVAHWNMIAIAWVLAILHI